MGRDYSGSWVGVRVSLALREVLRGLLSLVVQIEQVHDDIDDGLCLFSSVQYRSCSARVSNYKLLATFCLCSLVVLKDQSSSPNTKVNCLVKIKVRSGPDGFKVHKCNAKEVKKRKTRRTRSRRAVQSSQLFFFFLFVIFSSQRFPGITKSRWESKERSRRK